MCIQTHVRKYVCMHIHNAQVHMYIRIHDHRICMHHRSEANKPAYAVSRIIDV